MMGIDAVVSGLNRIEIDSDLSRAISAHSVAAIDVLCSIPLCPDSAGRLAPIRSPGAQAQRHFP